MNSWYQNLGTRISQANTKLEKSRFEGEFPAQQMSEDTLSIISLKKDNDKWSDNICVMCLSGYEVTVTNGSVNLYLLSKLEHSLQLTFQEYRRALRLLDRAGTRVIEKSRFNEACFATWLYRANGLSDEEIYQYCLNLKEHVPSRRSTRLPSRSKRGQKFSDPDQRLVADCKLVDLDTAVVADRRGHFSVLSSKNHFEGEWMLVDRCLKLGLVNRFKIDEVYKRT
ncbi:hypothetical protein Syun_027802 [Stephania yunnanensis]|uniref:Uncharacterized protein n=1 Tax=Stephania yunnanensis TaxID=152371 RepID=A0AAP0EG98_9MAGN